MLEIKMTETQFAALRMWIYTAAEFHTHASKHGSASIVAINETENAVRDAFGLPPVEHV